MSSTRNGYRESPMATNHSPSQNLCCKDLCVSSPNPKIFVRPSTLDEALAFVDELRRRPACHLFRPGPRHWDIFVSLCRRAGATGGLVADAYHAAVAIEHGCEWVTNDTDFARFPGLRWRLPHQACTLRTAPPALIAASIGRPP